MKDILEWMVFTAGYVIGAIAGLFGINLSDKGKKEDK